MVSANLDARLDQALPRLVAQGIRPEERAKTLEEHLARHKMTREALGDSATVVQQFAGYIDRIFVVPFGEAGYRWVSYGDLARARVSESEIDEIALKNLDSLISREAESKRINEAMGAFFHNFASSFLVSPSFVANLKVDRDSVSFIMPQRESLIFCGFPSEANLEYFDTIRKQFWSDPDVPESVKLCEYFVVSNPSARSGWSLSLRPKQAN